jgi:DNA-binding response OmpR family regulator
MLSTLLATEGFTSVCRDGFEALHLLRTADVLCAPETLVHPVDLEMPRLGGKEFRKAQLSDPTVASVPVAIMSGATDLEERARAWCCRQFSKPINCDVLLTWCRYCA